MASSLNNSAWLEWMATLMAGVSGKGASRQSYAATLPPDRFYCLLDELPLHLVPQRAQRSLRMREGHHQPLYLNPDCIFCTGAEIPGELASRPDLLSGFALQGTVAWVRSGSTGNLLPFWLGPELSGVIRSLRPNEALPAGVSDIHRRVLFGAGVLQTQDRAAWAREPDESFRDAALAFREKGYAPIGDLIHPFHVAALRRYYRCLIRTGAIRLGDGQSPRRYVAYNEPVARFFHHEIAPGLSAVAEALKPSYVYLASYLSGAELKKHTDREQCEFSVTLCLDFSPEPALATPWPIRLDTANGSVRVYQALGDGLAYRGTRLPHYRDPLGAGKTSTSIFFHYVASDFAGSLD
ncbi:MAG TPA: hypothetical protein VH350_10320 [Candidatus Sulfotelmatobacter sp.]|jgi:hypothetical protein|nr:hypothetical protein [Candidatus Sulfotelmatobacter sp.]